MVILQLNVDRFAFVALQIIEAEGKATTTQMYECQYPPYLKTGKMWPQIQWPIMKLRGLLLHR